MSRFRFAQGGSVLSLCWSYCSEYQILPQHCHNTRIIGFRILFFLHCQYTRLVRSDTTDCSNHQSRLNFSYCPLWRFLLFRRSIGNFFSLLLQLLASIQAPIQCKKGNEGRDYSNSKEYEACIWCWDGVAKGSHHGCSVWVGVYKYFNAFLLDSFLWKQRRVDNDAIESCWEAVWRLLLKCGGWSRWVFHTSMRHFDH